MKKYLVSCTISEVVEAESAEEAFSKSFSTNDLTQLEKDDWDVREVDEG